MTKLKPWMEWNDKGWILCLCCPTGKTTHKGKVVYYLGIKWSKCSRRKRANWLKAHRNCGFSA